MKASAPAVDIFNLIDGLDSDGPCLPLEAFESEDSVSRSALDFLGTDANELIGDAGVAANEASKVEESKTQVLLTWMYADLDHLAYVDALVWSTQKSFELTVAEINDHNKGFARPIYVTEYNEGGGSKVKKTYTVSSIAEL